MELVYWCQWECGTTVPTNPVLHETIQLEQLSNCCMDYV